MKDFYYKKIEVSIFLKTDVTEQQRTDLERRAEGRPAGQGGHLRQTKDEAYERFKEMYQDAPDLVERRSSRTRCPSRSGSS